MCRTMWIERVVSSYSDSWMLLTVSQLRSVLVQGNAPEALPPKREA